MLGLLELGPSRLVALSTALGALAFVWLEELLKRRSPRGRAWVLRLHAATAHPHEADEVSSGTWFVTAVALLVVFLPGVPAAAGVLVLTGADPVAGVVGRRFGTWRDSRGRSWEGSLAFAVAAFGLLSGFLVLGHGWPPEAAAKLAASAGVMGAAAERFVPVDDNLSVPVFVAVTVAALGHASN